jgi:hypothetical protein
VVVFYGDSISTATVKSGPHNRAGHYTGAHGGGRSEGTKRKRAVARAAAVTGRERQRRRRPLHKAGVAKKAAVAGSGRRQWQRPLQKAGGGDGGGR